MDKYIAEFPEQLEAAIQIGNTIPELSYKATVKNIIITGMGGSGIGAVVVKEFLKEKLSVPLEVNNDYTLPHYVNEHTLVICSSYSGNTEETIAAFHQAKTAGCSIVCITSGGKLQQLAIENDLHFVLLPGSMPPRTCLGYSMVAQLFVLLRSGWLDASIISDIKKAASFLLEQQDAIKLAREFAGNRRHRHDHRGIVAHGGVAPDDRQRVRAPPVHPPDDHRGGAGASEPPGVGLARAGAVTVLFS